MALPLALMLVEATAGASAALRSDRDDKGENDGFTCIALEANCENDFVILLLNSIKNTFV